MSGVLQGFKKIDFIFQKKEEEGNRIILNNTMMYLILFQWIFTGFTTCGHVRESTVDDTYSILFPFIPGFSPCVVLAMITKWS